MIKVIIAVIVLWLAYLARDQFPAFIVGMIIAYMLNRPVSFLCHRARMSRGLAVLLIYVLALGGTGVALWKGWSTLVDQATSLFQNREWIVTTTIHQISEATGWNPDVSAVTTLILEKVGNFITSQPEELLVFGGVVSRTVLFAVIVLLSSIYFLKDGEKFWGFCLRFVPESDRSACIEVTAAINHKFSKYIGGQFLLMAIMAVLVYIILSFYQLKYTLIVALIAGIAEIVPFFGPMSALALAVTIAASQLGLHGTWPVAALLVGARMLQDYVVIPKVMGHAVQLHPLVTLFFVMAGGSIDGGLGMVLAIPAAAAVNVVVDHFYPPSELPASTAGDASSNRWARTRAISADLNKLLQRGAAPVVAWLKSLGDN